MLDLSKRVRRSTEFKELIHELVQSSEPSFSNMADLLVFAAAFAYDNKLARRPFEGSDEQIAMSVFVNSRYDGFMLMLAAQSTGDYSIVSQARSNEMVSVFEEYANAGLESLSQRLGQRRRDVDVLREIALGAFYTPATTSDLDLEKLMSELG